MSEKTLFEKIIAREIPADIVYEDDDCICFKDIHPKAPIHLLLCPKKPIATLAGATAADEALLGKLMLRAGDIAREQGVGDAFRLQVHNGAAAGQEVFHLHLHILAD